MQLKIPHPKVSFYLLGALRLGALELSHGLMKALQQASL